MISRNTYLFLAALHIGVCGFLSAQEKDPEINKRKIRALLITGGCDQDYETQKTIITAGISERCRHDIEWKVVHQGDDFPNARIEVYEDKDWAKGFDVVIHNEYFPEVTDGDWVDRILKAHRNKTPAVLLHGTMLSYPVKDSRWADLCGIKCKETIPNSSLMVRFTDSEHPVSKKFHNFSVANEEIFVAEAQSPATTVLASIALPNDASAYPAIWTNRYGENKTKVFATSLGNNNDTMLQSNYLDILARGFLWALDEDVEKAFALPGSKEGSKKKLLSLGENLLSKQSAKSSSADAGKASDGDPESIWRQSKKGLINWWEGSLAKAAEVQAIAIYWESHNCFPYIIESSVNGKRWNRIARYSASGIRQRVAYHEIEEAMQYIRVSNPETGVVSGIREFAAYASLRNVPFHVKSAAYIPVRVKAKPDLQSEKTKVNHQKPLDIDAAFAILDNPTKSSEWEESFDQLSQVRQPKVVDQIIQRINETESGKLRNQAISALANLYKNEAKRTWQKSLEIARFLESLVFEKRVDKLKLIAAILRNNIPIGDVPRVMKVTAHDPALKELRVKLLQQNRLTYNSLDFLSDLVDDPSEDVVLKMKVGALLASSPDMLAMRDAFELASRSTSFEVDESQKGTLLNSVIRNTTWEAQADWLVDKTKSKIFGQRQLAWEILLYLLDDEKVRAPVKHFIKQQIVDTEAAGGNSLLSLVTVMDRLQNPMYSLFLERVSKLEAPVTASTAKAALARSKKTLPKVGNMPLKEVKRLVEEQDPADLVKGEALFKKSCLGCHKSGPKLNSIPENFPDHDDLIEAILNPDTYIAKDFPTVQLAMNDGNSYAGFVAEETKLDLTIFDQANNSVTIQKKDIMNRSTIPVSSMPDGTVNHLQMDEFANLLGYLLSL